MLTLTSPIETWLHRVPAGWKISCLCVATFALFMIAAPVGQAAALGALVALHLTCGPGFLRHALRMLRPIVPFVVIVGLWHLWTAELLQGATILLRMITVIAAANLVTMTTRLVDMMATLEIVARPLSPVLPPQRLALAMSLVIRFIPILSARLAQISEAFRARGKARPGWRILGPAALAALDDAEHVADALRARGGTR